MWNFKSLMIEDLQPFFTNVLVKGMFLLFLTFYSSQSVK
jgi:hypothetical protein